MSLSPDVFAQTLRDFFRPVHALLEDDSVCEVLVNSWDEVYIDRNGRLERTKARFSSEADLMAALTNLAQSVGKSLDPRSPMLEARLPDGSRVQALLPPLALEGPCLAIRCARTEEIPIELFVESNVGGRELCGLLRDLAQQKKNTVVCGDAASGKTALVAALISAIPMHERVIIVERSSELKPARGHVLRLEVPASEKDLGMGTSFAAVLRAALRMRPDRLIVGEVRGQESYELIRAMASGRAGCMTTLDASTPDDALRSIETMALTSMPSSLRHTFGKQVASAIDVVIRVARLADGRRRVVSISRVLESAQHPPYELQELYRSTKW